MSKMLAENQLFTSPSSYEHIENWIEKHPGEDKIHLYTASIMTWNLASNLTDVNRLDLAEIISSTLNNYLGDERLVTDITIELEGAISSFLDLDNWQDPLGE